MKKYIFILIAVLSFYSCSNDDDSLSSDKIVGTWGLYKEVDGGDTYTYDPNDKEEQITFNSDGTLSQPFGTATLTGTWKNLGNGKYQLSALGFTDDYKIEFIGNDEMKWTAEDYDYISYYKRIK